MLQKRSEMSKDTAPRTQSRRAASKEALKQMHLLLGSPEHLEISSDDDVIEVAVQPPKKKMKLSKKSTEESVFNYKMTNPAHETDFDLEVQVEQLNSYQKGRVDQLRKDEANMQANIDKLLLVPNTEIVYNGTLTTAYEITEYFKTIINNNQSLSANEINPLSSMVTIGQPPTQGIVIQQQPTTSGATLPQSYQLVLDPRSGVIVGAVPTNSTPGTTTPLQLFQSTIAPNATAPQTPEQPMKTRRGTVLRQVPSSAIPSLQKLTTPVKTPPVSKAGIHVKPALGKTMQGKPLPAAKIKTIPPRPIPKPQLPTQKPVIRKPPAITIPLPTVPAVGELPSIRPTESSVEGGLNMGGKQISFDLTAEDGRSMADSREVSFNKLQGRTYPSLVVVARPHLRVKDLTVDRSKLDAKVKSVLMFAPTKFTEWLIQQGLVRSDQKCSIHALNALKLGMYSDVSKFPHSGGYVWISECCPHRFVSVFSGSLFEGSQHPPMAVLKLLYHWSCQTIVQNVTQWVKVDNLYVKGMYTWLRSICTVALHTHMKPLGGPGQRVQIGVISLGTTSQDGNKREVKVEVLGVLETSTRHVRLRAIEPLVDGERNYKKRFAKILEPVFGWVHPGSIIVTDLTVDKATLLQMGFTRVIQTSATDYQHSNRTIMEYLRRIVPRMFQNTLSLLSRQIIQQFLDELVWREWYGTTVLECFDNMLLHLSEQTRHDSGQTLIVRLNKVIMNPFRSWKIAIQPTVVSPVKVPEPTTTYKRAYNRVKKIPALAPVPPAVPVPVPVVAPPQTQEVARPSKSTSPDIPEQMVPLENYYYGAINTGVAPKDKVTLNIKCPFCKYTFTSNITLMNHLFKHAHNVSSDAQICKYCLTIVPTAGDLMKHIAISHPDDTKFDIGFVCLICEVPFRNAFILGKHMSREHCPAELPYMCGTCNYRCSNHKMAVDHFYQSHDHGTTIQCPFCLKSTAIYSSGRNMSQNMNFFIQHLQKHQKKNQAKRFGTELVSIGRNSCPQNTEKSKKYIWNQFSKFCAAKDYVLDGSRSLEELSTILADWGCNMRKENGSDYKEAVVKLFWNSTAKSLQNLYDSKYNLKFDPFVDIAFNSARDARNAKRRELKGIPEKRTVSAPTMTPDQYLKIQNFYTEDTPTGLQRKFYFVVTLDLTWRRGEAYRCLLQYFTEEIDNMGVKTGRIAYNSKFDKGAENKFLVPNKDNSSLCPVRCGRCNLWFIQKEFLKDHQAKMHLSQRGKPGLVPCFAPRNGVMVPKSKVDQCPDDGTIIDFNALRINVAQNLHCLECKKPMNSQKHYLSFEDCPNSNCQYSTSCSHAMQHHLFECIELNSTVLMHKLPYEMFCICGYSNSCGNSMAKHLAVCERKSAYSSKQEAKNATARHSMLDVLGLVRKPDEPSISANKNITQPVKSALPAPVSKRGRPRKFPRVEPVAKIKEETDKKSNKLVLANKSEKAKASKADEPEKDTQLEATKDVDDDNSNISTTLNGTDIAVEEERVEESYKNDKNPLEEEPLEQTQLELDTKDSLKEQEEEPSESLEETPSIVLETVSDKEVNDLETVSDKEVNDLETISEKEVQVLETVSDKEVDDLGTLSDKEVHVLETVSDKEVHVLETVSDKEVNDLESVSDKEAHVLETVSDKEVNDLEAVSHKEVNVLEAVSKDLEEALKQDALSIEPPDVDELTKNILEVTNVLAGGTDPLSEPSDESGAKTDFSFTNTSISTDVNPTEEMMSVDDMFNTDSNSAQAIVDNLDNVDTLKNISEICPMDTD